MKMMDEELKELRYYVRNNFSNQTVEPTKPFIAPNAGSGCSENNQPSASGDTANAYAFVVE